ncbi:MAG: YadA-like family protein [Burkholderiaceae bacterium]|nr:YadA-like family protein [Burkholderiaceae bacterium]
MGTAAFRFALSVSIAAMSGAAHSQAVNVSNGTSQDRQVNPATGLQNPAGTQAAGVHVVGSGTPQAPAAGTSRIDVNATHTSISTGTGSAVVVDAAGTAISGTLSATGAATLNGGVSTTTLDATGTANLNGGVSTTTLDASGTANLNGGVNVTGEVRASGGVRASGIEAGGQRVTGVAGGVATGDATNVGQLNNGLRQANAYADTAAAGALGAARTYVDAQIAVANRVAYRGIASVAAMGAIPDTLPGTSYSIGIGTGHFEGESAFAFGIRGRANENINFMIGIGRAGQSTAVQAGMGWSF